jgi:superfamily II DNA or RNA helicase
MKETLLANLYNILHSTKSIKDNIHIVAQIRERLEEFVTDEERLKITHLIQDRAQSEAIQAFKANNYLGCIFMATGSGKSKIAITMSNQIVTHEGEPKILLVVPTTKLRDENWKDEYYKWGLGHIWEKNVTTCCYTSLFKYEGQTFDLVILDEGHNITPNNAEFFSNSVVRSCVLLTATKPTDQAKVLTLQKIGLKSVFELSLDECVTLGLVSPYDVYVITMPLNHTDKYIRAGGKKTKWDTTERLQYQYLSIQCSNAPSKVNYLKRMRFIYDLKSKTEVARLVLQHVIPKHLRTIIFCGSTDQADKVCEWRYHNKTNDKDYIRFKAGIIDRMSCVNAVNEGHNIPMLDVAFIVQLNSKELDLFQRIGRFLRYRPKHRGKIIILITGDTVEKEWWYKASQNINPDNITMISLHDLRHELVKIPFD